MNIPRSRMSGITIPEILIAVSVLLLVLAVGVPAADRIRNDGQTAEILATVDRLKEACRLHARDTGRMAVEFSASRGGEAYSGPRYHTLSIAQGIEGWRGPYLARPISTGDNPFRGPVYLQNNLSASPANGFRLAGSGGRLSTGPGQFVVFYGVPEHIARQVDQEIDKGFGSDEDWRSSGAVKWSDDGAGGLIVFLMEQER